LKEDCQTTKCKHLQYFSYNMVTLLKPNLQKQFGEVFEYGVESIVVQMTMFFTPMMVEIDEIFNVVM